MANFLRSSKTSNNQKSSIYTSVLKWFHQRPWTSDSSATRRIRGSSQIVSLSALATMSEDGAVISTLMLELAQWAATALDQEAVTRIVHRSFFHLAVRQEAAETDSQFAIAGTSLRRKESFLGSLAATQMANFLRRWDKHQVLDNLGVLLSAWAWATSIESSHISRASTPDFASPTS